MALVCAEPPTRLTFARWLVDRRSPTAARAIVNRVWQAYFATGLVSSSEDLVALAHDVQDRVEDRFGIRLEPEPVRLGVDL